MEKCPWAASARPAYPVVLQDQQKLYRDYWPLSSLLGIGSNCPKRPQKTDNFESLHQPNGPAHVRSISYHRLLPVWLGYSPLLVVRHLRYLPQQHRCCSAQRRACCSADGTDSRHKNGRLQIIRFCYTGVDVTIDRPRLPRTWPQSNPFRKFKKFKHKRNFFKQNF